MAQNVILEVRLPRILGALLVGASLAVAGAAYQGIFRNPLVSPDLLGVSSGACIGAAAAILAGWGAFGVQGAAFAGGLGAVACTVTIPKPVSYTHLRHGPAQDGRRRPDPGRRRRVRRRA